MAKRRTRSKSKGRRRQKIPTTPDRTGIGRHIRPIAKALVGLALALATFVAVGIAVWPNVHALPPGEAIDLNEPYAQPFFLQNAGNLPIFDAEVKCYPEHETVDFSQGQNVEIRVTTFHFIADKISHSDTRPFTCNSWQWLSGIGPEGKMFTPPKSITAADLVVAIRFRVIPLLPWRWSVNQRFMTHTETVTHKTYWREYRPPLN